MTAPASIGGRGEIAQILSGPHIKRVLIDADSPPLIEIEPLQYFAVVNPGHRHNCRIARWRSA